MVTDNGLLVFLTTCAESLRLELISIIIENFVPNHEGRDWCANFNDHNDLRVTTGVSEGAANVRASGLYV